MAKLNAEQIFLLSAVPSYQTWDCNFQKKMLTENFGRSLEIFRLVGEAVQFCSFPKPMDVELVLGFVSFLKKNNNNVSMCFK